VLSIFIQNLIFIVKSKKLRMSIFVRLIDSNLWIAKLV
jgi:hypothetical protein